MCRISGIYNPSLPIAQTEQMVREMCRLQKHGGPDDEGIYVDEKSHLVLGHRRLSLIDLSSAGHQPMHFDNDRYHITYNGEIYNYKELKTELEKRGCSFKTQTDTEVILAAYALWGRQAFAQFMGMFAFALYDKKEQDIYLVRGPSGIKPLYYAITEQGFAFASEVRAFAAIDYLQSPNPDWQVFLMAYGHLPEPVTTLKEVKPLVKGCFLRYNIATTNVELEVFSYYSFIEKYQDRPTAIHLIQDTLKAAVTRHMISDAPIGVFMSGGLDSSIISLLAKSSNQSALKTLSIYFEEAAYSEKPYQDILLDKLKTHHHQYLLTEKEFHQELPNIFESMDLPSCDGINTWFISKSAKENGLKAVLSGIGGDELFGGYPSFQRMATTNRLSKLPNIVLAAGKFADSKKLRRMAYLSIPGPVGKYLFLRGQSTPREIAQQLGLPEKQVWAILSDTPVLHDINHQTTPNQASWIELNMYMQNQLLRDSDVMSMHHGIEIRVPFLDYEFMKLVLAIKSSIKYAGDTGKQLLIDAFKDQLPEPIWNRPKMGFSLPFAEWLSNDALVSDMFMGSNKQAVQNYTDFKAGKLHWSQLMSLMLLGKSF